MKSFNQYLGVLILVLMEYDLRLRGGGGGYPDAKRVLILVLMEYGLRHNTKDILQSKQVLILVLMEYGLRPLVKWC